MTFSSAKPRAAVTLMRFGKHLFNRGFTLVETALAMGIIGFGLVGLLGLMPIGMTNYRDAVDRTAETQIFQALNSRIQQTDYSQRNTWDSREFGYDDRGLELKSTNGALYKATVSVKGSPEVPGTNAKFAYATTVCLEIENTASKRKSRFFSYLSDNGR